MSAMHWLHRFEIIYCACTVLEVFCYSNFSFKTCHNLRVLKYSNKTASVLHVKIWYVWGSQYCCVNAEYQNLEELDAISL